MSGVPVLYERLIERDLEAIEPAVRAFRAGASSADLFLAVARFAVLSYAPSQHARHAVLAVLSVHDLRDELGDRFDDALIECAKYAAGSRQPWSEPPIADPPAVDPSHPADLAELRAAIESRDRLRAERWLAARLDDPDLPRDLIAVAAEDVSDLGHTLIMADAALRLAPILGEKGRFVTLRMAVWEMTSAAGERPRTAKIDPPALLQSLIERTSDVSSAHSVFLFEAALRRGVLEGLAGTLMDSGDPAIAPPPAATDIPIYALARDLGATLKAHAVAARLRPQFPQAGLDRFLAAVHHNLEHGLSLEEWSFA